ncbi:MAG: DsbA family protein [Candidatus Latescibacteria bacterium]|nr:DsbA family protein [Candidatus Latescibacterota bacterium]
MSASISVDYYTDPMCSWSWAFQPVLERIRQNYRDRVRIRCRMLPIYEDISQHTDPRHSLWGSVRDLAEHWREVAQQTGAWIDPGLWLEDPPETCWTACQAYHAAARQDRIVGDRFLLMMREAFLKRRLNVARMDRLGALAQEAAGQMGLDPERLMRDVKASWTREAVEEDRHAAAEEGIRERPTLVFEGGHRLVSGPYRLFAGVIDVLLEEKAKNVSAGEGGWTVKAK